MNDRKARRTVLRLCSGFSFFTLLLKCDFYVPLSPPTVMLESTIPIISPTQQPMEDTDTLKIMEQIDECGILDSSPLRSRTTATEQYTVNDAAEDGWNTENSSDELEAAINNCGILEAAVHYRTRDQHPLGTTKKKVFKQKADGASI